MLVWLGSWHTCVVFEIFARHYEALLVSHTNTEWNLSTTLVVWVVLDSEQGETLQCIAIDVRSLKCKTNEVLQETTR